MTRRDYFIIFCLLLPFFITLPWLIVSRQQLSQQRELVELTRDTLHINNLRCARLQLSSEQYIERNKALEKNNQMLVQKLTERGIKVVTQELPPNPRLFAERAIVQQKKAEELVSSNEQLSPQEEVLRREDPPAPPVSVKSVPAPQSPSASSPVTTASEKRVPSPNRKKDLGPPLVETASAPQETNSSRYQRTEKNKPTVVKNATSTPPVATTRQQRAKREPEVEITSSTAPVSGLGQHKEPSGSSEDNTVSTPPVSASEQQQEARALITADKEISAPVVSSASSPQPTRKETPPDNLAPKGIRIIAIGARMQEQITRAGIEGLAGENFGVDLLAKEASSSSQQRIVVEFDLKDVPTSYQGVRELFLVLTDRSGEVIITPQSTTANVPFNGSILSLKTTAKTRAEFGNDQRLRIQQTLSAPLAKGRYRAQVYCDLAVLGFIDFEVL